MKNCLIIDNADQAVSMKSLKRDAKKKGIEIDCFQFNVGSIQDTKLLTNNNIDISKVISEFKIRFKGIQFHVAAFDWDLSDNKIDGIELIRQFNHNKLLKNTPKILYSGLLDQQLAAIINNYDSKSIKKEELINRIKTLIKTDIKGFVDRDDYVTQIIHILEDSDESLDLIIKEELMKFPNFKFSNKFISASFQYKTFAEISKFLEDDNKLRNEFKREIIQQVIAYLTETI